jgi:tRNA pseudouridine55 synthase
VAEKAVTEPLAELVPKVSTALTEMQGEIELPVSAYSAIKVDGTPMYKRARRAERRGETVPDVPLRTMQVLSAELQKLEQQEAFVVAAVRFHVGSGTYIRSLAEELGRRVGYPATVQALRRTHVGEYRIEDAAPVPATK